MVNDFHSNYHYHNYFFSTCVFLRGIQQMNPNQKVRKESDVMKKSVKKKTQSKSAKLKEPLIISIMISDKVFASIVC